VQCAPMRFSKNDVAIDKCVWPTPPVAFCAHASCVRRRASSKRGLLTRCTRSFPLACFGGVGNKRDVKSLNSHNSNASCIRCPGSAGAAQVHQLGSLYSLTSKIFLVQLVQRLVHQVPGWGRVVRELMKAMEK